MSANHNSTRWQRLNAQLRLPYSPPPRPLTYTPLYVGYVVAVSLGALVVALITIPGHFTGKDLLLLGSLACFASSASSVSLVSRNSTHWSAAGFIHLVQAIVVGPAGAAGAALGSGLGGALRLGHRDTRIPFNISCYFLFDIAAWLVFDSIAGRHPSLGVGAVAGATAGIAQLLVNIVLLTLAVALSTPGTKLSSVALPALTFLPYNIGYGWAAYGGFLLYGVAGAAGVSFLYVPVGLVQLFLITLGRRIEEEEREQARHRHEREALLTRVIESSDVERQRIARNLHDGVVQDLSALMMGLRTFADSENGADAQTVTTLRRAADAAEEAVSELRTLLREMVPENLNEMGLRDAVEDLCEPLREGGTRCEVTIDEACNSGPLVTTSFRICQEALRNVSKHAHARRVTVSGEHVDGTVQLTIVDDGAGFDTEQLAGVRGDGHIGLQLLHDLAAQTGGSLGVDSAPTKGTTLIARLPLAETNR